MPPKKNAATTKSARQPEIGNAEAPKAQRRSTAPRLPRWSRVYDDQRRAIETARKEGVEEIAIVIEGHDKQVTRFDLNREMVAEMLAHISYVLSSGEDAQSLRPSDALAKAMLEAEGDLPVFRTKEELFDALEAAD